MQSLKRAGTKWVKTQVLKDLHPNVSLSKRQGHRKVLLSQKRKKHLDLLEKAIKKIEIMPKKPFRKAKDKESHVKQNQDLCFSPPLPSEPPGWRRRDRSIGFPCPGHSCTPHRRHKPSPAVLVIRGGSSCQSRRCFSSGVTIPDLLRMSFTC